MSNQEACILLFEDNPGDAFLLKDMLETHPVAAFKLERVERLAVGLQRLSTNRYDVVLLDLSLPDSQGIETFNRVQQAAPRVPVVVLSGLDDETLAVQAVREGAQDYLVKGRVDGNLLVRSIYYAIERNRVQQALRDEERKREKILETMIDGMVVIDLNGNFTYANRAAAATLGFDETSLPQQHLLNLVCNYDPHRRENEGEQPNDHPLSVALTRQRQVEEQECRFITRSGEQKWLSVNAAPLFDEAGQLYGAIASFRDITERKRAQENIRRREAILEAVGFTAERLLKTACWESGLELVLEHLGQALQASRAYFFENQVTEDGSPHAHPRDYWVVPGIGPLPGARWLFDFSNQFSQFGRWMELLRQGLPVIVVGEELSLSEKALLEKVGIYSIVAIPVFVEQEWWGILYFDFIQSHWKISVPEVEALQAAANTLGAAVQRSRVETALRRSETLYRVLVEQISDAIVIIDQEGIVRFVNPATETLFQRSTSDLLTEAFGFPLGSEDAPEINILRKDRPAAIAEMRVTETEWAGEPVYLVSLRDITARKQAEEKIAASLREKEALLKEIHHRVKNNMQVISSLLNLQTYEVKDKQVLEVLRESQSRIKSMALVHEKLYQSPDLALIDFGAYIRSLATYLFRMYVIDLNRISLAIDVQDVYLSVDVAIPCGLIVNELISNCLKHAFPDGRTGQISIHLHPLGDFYELVIQDDGVGLPAGLNFRETESLGMQLICTLIRQIDGQIETSQEAGTTFRILFQELK